MVKLYNRIIISLLSIVLAVLFIFPFSSSAQEDLTENTVRVGWHEAPYFMTDQYDRKSGYTYEYQWKISAYTGWSYDYVQGSWSDLFEKLKAGEIDMMGNISYSEERAEDVLFSSLPMGTETYYIFVAPDNMEIRSDDLSTLNGKTIGVTQGTIQKDQFLKWEELHGINANLVEINGDDEDSLRLLGSRLDAFITMDVYGNSEIAVPVTKIGSSDYYFAVSKDRPDLLERLEEAMNRIQDENKFYNQQLSEKYLSKYSTNQYLNSDEQEWLSNHGTIRVGYQDGYLAFCASDPKTGELTGALKDYLAYASTALENANLDFEAISFPSAAAAIEAMKNGEVDCMFPANLTDYDSETLDVVMTNPLMRTEMDAVVRASEQKEFIRKTDVRVAVNEGNTNYDMWLSDHYPTWKRVYFKDTPTGLDAVAAGEVDCVIISNYRYNNISKQCERLHLTTVYTGVDMDYCFAVPKGEVELYSILSRAVNAVPVSVVHTALTYYSTEDVKTSFADLLKDNLLLVLGIILLVLAIVLILFLRGTRAKKKVVEEQRIVNTLNKRLMIDMLTSVKNKGAFENYTQELQDQLDRGDQAAFAMGMFDCDNLKLVNDMYGHDKGDVYIKTASQLICRVFQHSPVFRIGGDEFAVILQNEDYKNREKLIKLFLERQKEICAEAQHRWEEARVSIGVAVYDPSIDTSVAATLHRADSIMYENKRIRKEQEK